MLTFLLMIDDDNKRNKLEDLYITYKKELFYVAYQILHDYDDAEDIIQNAFIRISNHLDKIGEIRCKKTKAYMVIIVRNLSFDRYNQKRKTVLVDFLSETMQESDGGTSLEDHVLNLEQGKLLAESLSKINLGYADILTLRYYYEYSTTEISELLNLSVDNVCVRLHRAKASLKKILSEGGVVNE